MTLDKVFELVRKEQIVIWAGSGFSRYAGYPTGSELTEILLQSLSTQEKKKINKKLLLPDLAEEYVRLKGGSRNELISILRRTFSKKPSSLRWHEVLSTIPHFKTIITTNYDNLFEQAYKSDAIAIHQEEDVPYIIDDKVEIFKAHGDITRPSSIIITRSDYAKFFANSTQYNLFWSILTERVASKSVIFIGYNFEDDNVINFFHRIWNILKLNKKEVFLIAPKLSQEKKYSLIQRDIQYLNFKAEIFIEKLYKNIEANIRSDFDKGFVKVETFRRFFNSKGLDIELGSKKDKFYIKSISGIDGKFHANLSLKLKEDKEFQSKLNDIFAGKRFEEFELSSENLRDFKFEASGIKLLDSNDLLKLTFTPRPSSKGEVDIFFDDHSEISSVTYALYASNEFIQIEADYKNTRFKLSFPKKNNEEVRVDYHFEHTNKFERTKDAIDVYNFLNNLAKGNEMKVFVKNLNQEFPFHPGSNYDLKKFVEPRLEYYKLLGEIENLYKIRFRGIDEPKDEFYNHMLLLKKYADEKEIMIDCDEELVFDLNRESTTLDLLQKMNSIGGAPIVAQFNEKTLLEVHGQNITLGFPIVEYCEPYVINLEEVIQNKDAFVKVKSRIKKIKVKFLKKLNPHFEAPDYS